MDGKSTSRLAVLLFVLTTYQTMTLCNASIAPLTNAKREGYARLVRDIKSHSISSEKVPPVVMDFDPLARNNTSDMNVTLTLMPVEILGLDSSLQILQFSGYITLIWYDPELTWDPSDYGGVKNIELPSSSIWTPTLSVLNGAEEKNIFIDGDYSLNFLHDGMVLLPLAVNWKTTCNLDLTNFPFDQQTCTIRIFSITGLLVNLRTITFHAKSIESILDGFSAGGEWSVANMTLTSVDSFPYRGEVKDVQVEFILRRKTTYYLVSIVGPMALFTLMNCLVFIIPCQSGEKISFLISIFLSNTIFSSFLSGVMPRGLNRKLPLLMVYQTFMWLFSIIVVLATVIVLKKFNKEQQRGGRWPKLQNSTSPNPLTAFRTSLASSVTTALGAIRICCSSTNRVAAVREFNEHSENCSRNGKDGSRRASSTCKMPGDNQPSLSSPEDELPVHKASSFAMTAENLDHIFFVVSLIIVLSFDGLLAMSFVSGN